MERAHDFVTLRSGHQTLLGHDIGKIACGGEANLNVDRKSLVEMTFRNRCERVRRKVQFEFDPTEREVETNRNRDYRVAVRIAEDTLGMRYRNAGILQEIVDARDELSNVHVAIAVRVERLAGTDLLKAQCDVDAHNHVGN